MFQERFGLLTVTAGRNPRSGWPNVISNIGEARERESVSQSTYQRDGEPPQRLNHTLAKHVRLRRGARLPPIHRPTNEIEITCIRLGRWTLSEILCQSVNYTAFTKPSSHRLLAESCIPGKQSGLSSLSRLIRPW